MSRLFSFCAYSEFFINICFVNDLYEQANVRTIFYAIWSMFVIII